MSMLHIMTVIFGVAGMIAGIGMIGVKSILDVWWQLSGIFAAGMLGLFLLGMISRQTGNHEAMIATIIGVLVILWLTFPMLIPDSYASWRSTLNTNMIIVVGTLTIFLTGLLITGIKRTEVPTITNKP